MPDTTCGHCRKIIPLVEARARVRIRCPFCKTKLTVPPPAETGVTVGRHASLRTPPPPEWLTAPRFDAPLPRPVRLKRGANDAKIAAVALLLVGLLGGLVAALPRFWRPRVGPTPPRQLTLPVDASPAPQTSVETPAEPTPLTTHAAPAAHHKQLPEPAEEGDPRTGRFRAKLKSLEWLYGPPQNLTYSADFRRAAFLSRGMIVRVWDVEAPKELLLLLCRDVVRVAFSADGSRALAVDGNGIFSLWDLAAGVELRRMDAGRVQIVSLCFSPNGCRALVGQEAPNRRTALRMWDLKTGREVTDLFAWRAEWILRAAATVLNPVYPPFAEIGEEATTTAHTLHVPTRPVEAEGAGPVDAPVYLLSTMIGKQTINEIVHMDDCR